MRKVGWFGLMGLALCGTSLIVAADDKVPSVEEIMKKAHKAKTGLRDQIAAELKKEDADWSNVQAKSHQFVKLAEALAKNDPPKGDKESWKKLSADYLAEVKALDEGVAKKDASTTREANKRLGMNCKTCHEAHRE